MTQINLEETKQTAAEKASQIPNPVGYRLLCMIPKIEDKFQGGIIKADETIRVEEQTTVVLFVVKVGPEAYKDEKRFPNGPWCKEGDFVICRTYAGTRMNIHGTEFRLVNDDSVEAVVDDPRGIRRA
jgi:co-chaperonin GroES (HSP10)